MPDFPKAARPFQLRRLRQYNLHTFLPLSNTLVFRYFIWTQLSWLWIKILATYSDLQNPYSNLYSNLVHLYLKVCFSLFWWFYPSFIFIFTRVNISSQVIYLIIFNLNCTRNWYILIKWSNTSSYFYQIVNVTVNKTSKPFLAKDKKWQTKFGLVWFI